MNLIPHTTLDWNTLAALGASLLQSRYAKMDIDYLRFHKSLVVQFVPSPIESYSSNYITVQRHQFFFLKTLFCILLPQRGRFVLLAKCRYHSITSAEYGKGITSFIGW